jgi:5-methylthioadenosine/S-adenosylhomocysteine deaminase
MAGFIRAKYLLPFSDQIGRHTRINDGYAVYNGEKIVEVGAYTAEVGRRLLRQYGVLEVIGKKTPVKRVSDLICHNGVLLPGFVKAHGHESESAIIGIAKDVPLTTWLDSAVNPFFQMIAEKRDELTQVLGECPLRVTYLKSRLDDIYYGITSSLNHHCSAAKYYIREMAEANEIAGTRMIMAIGSVDRNYFEKVLDRDHDKVIARLDEAWAMCQNMKLTSVIPGPDQCFSNTPELLKKLKKWANDHSSLIHIHSSEEYQTTEWFKKQYGMTPVEYFNSVGFLDSNTLIAHQVQCTGNDLEILRKTGASVVHNPLANTILGSGMPPIIRMLELGIAVVIATDGSGSADNQNILAAARLSSQYQKALNKNATLLPAQKVLEMITVDPAKILHLNAGSLEAGKDADIVLIDLRHPNLVPTTSDTVVENLIWASDGSEAQYVIAAGRVLKDNYAFTTINEQDVLAKMQLMGDYFAEYRKNLATMKGTGAHQ